MTEKLKYAPVDCEDGARGEAAYRLMDELLGSHHSTLQEARIALVWEFDVKPDRDGHLVWGRAKKVGPLEKQFHEHDFLILLNLTVWEELPETARRALLDHELSHCGVESADDGSLKFYVRRHDVEDFVEVVRRHGLWRQSVEDFVNAALARKADQART